MDAPAVPRGTGHSTHWRRAPRRRGPRAECGGRAGVCWGPEAGAHGPVPLAAAAPRRLPCPVLELQVLCGRRVQCPSPSRAGDPEDGGLGSDPFSLCPSPAATTTVSPNSGQGEGRKCGDNPLHLHPLLHCQVSRPWGAWGPRDPAPRGCPGPQPWAWSPRATGLLTSRRRPGLGPSVWHPRCTAASGHSSRPGAERLRAEHEPPPPRPCVGAHSVPLLGRSRPSPVGEPGQRGVGGSGH